MKEECLTSKIQKLQEKESYSSYQEDLAFAKELNILRNDFYYQMIDDKHVSLVDFLYQPLDVISGDAYSARKIDEHRTFYLLVDGMGNGLSASLTAMIMTSFVNHLIDRMVEYDSFSLDILVKESMEYIKPILLDEEALAIDYILLNTAYDMLSYAKFGMPSILMQDSQNSVVKLKSNNAPLSKWQSDYKINEHSIEQIDKFLFYSDGIVENITKDQEHVYADFIEDDFVSSFTREEFKNRFLDKIDEAEDDITLIFINRLPIENSIVEEKLFETSLSDVEKAGEWYQELLGTIENSSQISNEADLVFTELFMNAYEHGNLGIDNRVKHRLIEEDSYFETLLEKEKSCTKKIKVTLSKVSYKTTEYVVTQINDEGEGFDTQILSEIFRNSQIFNGRGVFISRKNSLGIYYNSKGNSVLYLNRIMSEK
ncbi:MAG: SpoIIE family protein phosphatase [Campylobacterota bacterium]|nr:SpoIIE family protein phosphatase [Campylobacterota bacterium]